MLEEIKKYSIRKYNEILDEEVKNGIKITRNNVQELWELYENTPDAYTDENCTFEGFVKYDVKRCANCGNYVLEDDIGTSELAMTDKICRFCEEDGYGE